MAAAVRRAMRATWSRVSSGVAEPSTPTTRRGRPPASSRTAKPAIIPACVEPVTEHTTIVSKNTPSSRSCSATSIAQPAKPWPPSGWSEAPAGIAYGLPPAARTSASACSQLALNPMPKPAGVEADVRAHEAAHQDVARAVVGDVGPVHPVLLDEDAFEARVCGHRRDLAGVVGLDAADRHERVAALGEGVGEEVLELADLVAAEREAAVAVLALGPHGGAAEVLRQAVEPLDR